jgi:hypothetical protein
MARASRLLLVPAALCAVLLAYGQTPLPDRQQLKARAIANMKKSEKALENYSCIVREQVDDLNADGTVKHSRSKKLEQFYVNGIQIQHLLAKDGQPLAPDDAKKEQQRVDREVKKYSDPENAQKARADQDERLNRVLEALRFENGRREIRDGRSIIAYDLSGDPGFHPKNIEGRFAEALVGRIWLDEETATPVEARVETARDVKIGGGLLANIHKGFRFRMQQERQPDGVWILKSLDGSGDARAALFLHPRFRFRQDLDQCRLFSVNVRESTRHP